MVFWVVVGGTCLGCGRLVCRERKGARGRGKIWKLVLVLVMRGGEG